MRVQALNPPRDTAATTAISVQSEAGLYIYISSRSYVRNGIMCFVRLSPYSTYDPRCLCRNLVSACDWGQNIYFTPSLPPSSPPLSSQGSGAQGGSVAMNTSSSGLSLTPASIQGVGSSAVAAELSHVLSGLQQSGELSTVLQQQPHLVEGITRHTPMHIPR